MKEFGDKLNSRLNSLDGKTNVMRNDKTTRTKEPYDDTMTGEESKNLNKAQSM